MMTSRRYTLDKALLVVYFARFLTLSSYFKVLYSYQTSDYNYDLTYWIRIYLILSITLFERRYKLQLYHMGVTRYPCWLMCVGFLPTVCRPSSRSRRIYQFY